MNKSEIDKINKQCPDLQGIFTQPNYIPISVKEPVIYKAQLVGGISGGSCWESSNPQPYTIETRNEDWVALDLVLTELKPSITYLQYKKMTKLIHSNTETHREYYGNSEDYLVEYIILSELEAFLEDLI
jgi:hypothetical protein